MLIKGAYEQGGVVGSSAAGPGQPSSPTGSALPAGSVIVQEADLTKLIALGEQSVELIQALVNFGPPTLPIGPAEVLKIEE